MSIIAMDKQRDLVEFIVKALVNHPEEVKIDCREDDSARIIEINAAGEDYGKIIGKKGRIVNSIRTLVSMTSDDHEKKWVLDVPNKQDQNSEA